MGLKKGKRYDTSGLVEAQHEPGSRGRVLKNLLGIKTKREMDVVKEIDQVCLASCFDSFWSSLLFDVLAPNAILS